MQAQSRDFDFIGWTPRTISTTKGINPTVIEVLGSTEAEAVATCLRVETQRMKRDRKAFALGDKGAHSYIHSASFMRLAYNGAYGEEAKSQAEAILSDWADLSSCVGAVA